ncbi:hypothetical protein LCGC14_0371220 [marine sediment metagenome]|uniref:Uncharacterized protein n=2 Tax=root TaxID=1 RepID=A0A0F9VSK3_9ZZZZ
MGRFDTPQKAWQASHSGDWMLWLAQRLNINKRLLTLAKGKCAETVLHLMKDDRSKAAINAAIDYGNGLIDDRQLTIVSCAAGGAAGELAESSSAEFSAHAADIASCLFGDSYYSAYYAAKASAEANADSYYASTQPDEVARKRNELTTANICRDILTESVFEKL